MATSINIVPVLVETYDGYGVSAIARLKIGGHVVRYAGGSRYEDKLVEGLVEEFARALGSILNEEDERDGREQAELAIRWEREVV